MSNVYFTGAVGLIWFAIWWTVVKDGPENDPRISPEELKYIQDSLGNTSLKVTLHFR
jgi:ACS family sodium-dependent inorganic phosphate cotransporter